MLKAIILLQFQEPQFYLNEAKSSLLFQILLQRILKRDKRKTHQLKDPYIINQLKCIIRSDSHKPRKN